jgi:hypothetical protein
LLEQLKMMHETGQAVEHSQFPKTFESEMVSVWFGREKSSPPSESDPDHLDSTGSELLQE